MKKGIPVRVKNSYNPEHIGSVILSDEENKKQDKPFVKALTCKRNVTLVDIVSSRMLGQYGFLAKVFEIFNRHKISVDMLASSEVSISLTLNDDTGIELALEELKEVASTVKVANEKAIVSIIGDVKRSHDILSKSCQVFSEQKIGIEMLSQGASKVNIGFVVKNSEVDSCIKNLHNEFFPHKV